MQFTHYKNQFTKTAFIFREGGPERSGSESESKKPKDKIVKPWDLSDRTNDDRNGEPRQEGEWVNPFDLSNRGPEDAAYPEKQKKKIVKPGWLQKLENKFLGKRKREQGEGAENRRKMQEAVERLRLKQEKEDNQVGDARMSVENE